MIVLGIETSCDETAVALYDNSKNEILAHELYSQVNLHAQYGGVVPELASRDHIQKLLPLLDTCLQKAKIKKEDIDGIAYTAGPGLIGALMVGAALAKSLSFAWNKPSIGIHHLEGHLLAPLLEPQKPNFPFIALLVSGGHTLLIKVNNLGAYELLGDTLDDAAGEAFDKTAKCLGLPYPGGKALSELAQNGEARFKLPIPMGNSNNLDFSFSGLKTAARQLIEKESQNALLSHQQKCDLAASFEKAIITSLVHKALAATKKTGLKRLVISGGVSANRLLRNQLNEAQNKNLEVFFPRLEYCTDNAAMIALVGALYLQKGLTDQNLEIQTFARKSIC